MSLSNSEHDMIGFAIAGIGALGLALNWSLYKKVSKQSDSNKLLFNMIITNFGLIVLDFPFPVYSSFQHKWAFNSALCTFYGSSSLVFGYNIMLTVVMLCLDMLFEKKYVDYDSFKTRVRDFMIGYMWVNCLFWGLAPVFGWSRISQELTKTSCTVDFVNADSSYNSYIISCFVLIFAGPILTMLYCAFADNKEVLPEKNLYADKKVLTLILMFIVVWTPYAICYMWPLFGSIDNLSIKFNAAAPVIAKLSVLTTPFLYWIEENEEETKKAQ